MKQAEFRERISRSASARAWIGSLSQSDQRHLLRLLIFLGLYLAAASAAVLLAGQIDSAWVLLLNLPLYLLAAASLHGISLFTHEGVHDTLSRNRRWNHLLSVFCAMPVLQNYTAYRVLHLAHHDDTGTRHDPDHFAGYTERRWLLFAMHWGRLLLGYPVYITMIPLLGWRQGNRTDRRAIVCELLLLAACWGVLLWLTPMSILLHAWLLPMLLINTMVNIRGMSQHTLLEEPEHDVRGTRTILTSPLVTFFMCNENYHLEHHLYPAVPWYNLPRLHARLAPQLRAQGAPFIPSYFSFVRSFVRHSFALLR